MTGRNWSGRSAPGFWASACPHASPASGCPSFCNKLARIRSAVYYIVGGGVALAVVPLLTRIGQPATVLELSPVVWQVLATAGFAGGFVYWLLAGRTA